MATYVLVHGAWHDSQCWRRVTPALTAAGHRVVTPSLTGHGEKRHLLAPEVGLIPGRIARLVFVDALVPAHGESAVDVMPVTQRSLDRAARSDQPWRVPPLPRLPAPLGLYGVTDPDDVAWLESTLSDESALCFVQPAELDHPAHWATILVLRLSDRASMHPGCRQVTAQLA